MTQAATPTMSPTLSMEPIMALEPLVATGNLIRVWYFDNSTKAWTFFDPRPAFTAANTVTTMIPGQIYWVRLISDQTTVLNAELRILTAGWNILTW